LAQKILPVEKQQKILLDISGITHSGEGVGRYEGLALFVPGAVPGDTVRVQVTDLKKSYAAARLLEIVSPSRIRKEPRCPLFSSCGGCRLQHVDYREQLMLKTGLVRDSLSRIAGLASVTVRETAGMEDPWHYRNKAHFQVKESSAGIDLGFYEEGSHILAPFGDGGGSNWGCLLVDRDLNRAASVIKSLLNGCGGSPDNQTARFFRHVVLRKGFSTGEIMAAIVTGGGLWPGEECFAKELTSAVPRITSLIRNINEGPPGPVLGSESRLLAGREYITDRLEDLTFIISPSSFYQVNPAQTRVLYQKALEFSGLLEGGAQTVVDAYSGIGTVALFIAAHAHRVLALEIVRGAVEDARRNAMINNVRNIEFHTGEVEKILPAMAAGGLRPDAVLLDPPRKGARPEVLEAVSAMGPARVVYISCDPGTMSRDLGLLAAKGYRVEEVQPVDMFPWTHHVETVVLMSRKDK